MRIDQSLDSHVQMPIAYHIKYKNPYCNSQDRVHITCGPLKKPPSKPHPPRLEPVVVVEYFSSVPIREGLGSCLVVILLPSGLVALWQNHRGQQAPRGLACWTFSDDCVIVII